MKKRLSADWAIMSASLWISGRPSIEKIIKENKRKSTILVVDRIWAGDNKPTKIFILGSAGEYGKIDERISFIHDTGMGYGKNGNCTIKNVIQIDEDKIIDKGNGIGVSEKRSLWVFK